MWDVEILEWFILQGTLVWQQISPGSSRFELVWARELGQIATTGRVSGSTNEASCALGCWLLGVAEFGNSGPLFHFPLWSSQAFTALPEYGLMTKCEAERKPATFAMGET